MKCRFLVTAILIALSIASCSVNTSESSQSIATQNVVSIDELPPEVTESEYVDPISLLTPYPVADCEFVVSGNHIEASYSDDLYSIDYDLNYYDYGVSQVSIFSANASRHLPRYTNSVLPEGWRFAQFTDSLLVSSWDSDEVNPDMASYASDIVNTISVENIEDIDSIVPVCNLVGNDIVFFQFALRYDYSPDSDINLTDLIRVTSLNGSNALVDPVNNETSGSVTRYVIREKLAGLPISIQNTNSYLGTQYEVHFDDLHGSIPGNEYLDAFESDFFSFDDSTFVDVVYTNYEDITCDGEWLPVCPVEQCLNESISPVIHKMFNRGCSHARVYHAELLYIPFFKGSFDPPFINPLVKLVPVWTFYYFADEDGHIRNTGVVYVNAISGEAVTRRMTLA